MKTAHVFAGYGGGMLADLILGHEPTEALELDERACDHLESRKDWFPSLRVHRADIREFDATDWKGRVDILHAGIPCPKWSSARRGRGATFDGWPDTLRIISDARPPIVFLECVEAFKRETPRVRAGLERIGYGLRRPIITDAAGLGAPHSRRRYWALGYSHDEGEPMLREYAEVAVMSPVDAGFWWEADARNLGMDDGLAGRVHRYTAVGNGQVPIQAAASFLMLGGPCDVSKISDH